ncbi:MAG: D-amino-acid transaminase [Campylobacteraceae bacterium]|nr:D-amino-acid transaminase [Campylobacteraceae bacterium]
MSEFFEQIVYLNGEFIKAKDAKVSVFDRGFIFGDGVYEVMPIINSKLVDKNECFERLRNSLKEIEINFAVNESELEQMAYSLIKKNGIIEGAIYIEITRGVAPRNFVFLENLEPTVMAFVYKTEILENPLAKNGIEIVSTDDIRWKRRDIKSISLLAQCMAKTKAHRAGAVECVMIEDGFITEGASSSFFIIKDGVLITKSLSNSILPGIRRKNILKFASDIGLKIEERNLTLDEAFTANEVFMSAATWILLPVVKIDGKVINGGKIGKFSMKLRELYKEKLILETKNSD